MAKSKSRAMPELLSKHWFAWRLSNAPAMPTVQKHMICSERLVVNSHIGFQAFDPSIICSRSHPQSHVSPDFLAVAGLGTRYLGRESLTLGSAAFEAATLEPEHALCDNCAVRTVLRTHCSICKVVVKWMLIEY
jgi:hypothetical protein